MIAGFAMKIAKMASFTTTAVNKFVEVTLITPMGPGVAHIM